MSGGVVIKPGMMIRQNGFNYTDQPGYLWFINYGTKSLCKVDVALSTVTQVATVADTPWSLAIDNVNAYIGCYTGSAAKLYTVNKQTGAQTNGAMTGVNPTSMAVSGGVVYYSGSANDTINGTTTGSTLGCVCGALLTDPTKTIWNTQSSGPGQYALAMGHDGRSLYVSKYNTVVVSKYLAGPPFTGAYDLSTFNRVLGIHVDRKYLWTSQLTGYLYRHDLDSSNGVQYTMTAAANCNCIVGDENYIWTAASGKLNKFSKQSLTVVSSAYGSFGSGNMCITQDRLYIYVGDYSNNNIYKVDKQSDATVATIATGYTGVCAMAAES